MRIHNGEKPFDCKLCGKWFTEKSSVKRHLRKMHYNQYNKKCSVCGIISKTREEHRDHLVTHKLKVYTCQICSKDFIDSRALKVHVFNAHSQITQSLNLKEYRCQECDKQFFSTKGLKNHLKTHKIDVQTFNCEICNKLFFNEQQMISHMKTHSTNKERYCEKCDKHFNSAAYAAFHRKQHILEKLNEVLAEKDAKQNQSTSDATECDTDKPSENDNSGKGLDKEKSELDDAMDISSGNVEVKSEPVESSIADEKKDEDVSGDSNMPSSSNEDVTNNVMDLKDIQAAFTDHLIRLQHFKHYSCFYFFKAKDAGIDEIVLTENEDKNVTFNPEHRKNAWFQMDNGVSEKKARCFSLYRCNECRTFKLRKREIVRHHESMHGGRLSVYCNMCSAV